jgi:hypothetical protein
MLTYSSKKKKRMFNFYVCVMTSYFVLLPINHEEVKN